MLPFGLIYLLSIPELKALYVCHHHSHSPHSLEGTLIITMLPLQASILFVKKSDGSLRLCVDYRGLTAGMITNIYPLPQIRETLMRLSKARYYIALDVCSTYNLLRVAEGDE